MKNLPAETNRHVLIIDDNPAIHDDFRKILAPAPSSSAAFDASEEAVFGPVANEAQPAEFTVDSAYQGEEGARLVKVALETGRPYAVAFVDLRMPPGWDGVETTRRLWELDPSLQVVLCSAYSDYSWGEMFAQLGRSDGLLLLKKPFDAAEAFQLAHALTEKWSLHQLSRQKVAELEQRVAERTSAWQLANHALALEVAEHQRAAETLRLLASAVEQSTEAIVITDADLDLPGPKIVFVNPAFTKMTGYTAADAIGQTPRILQGPKTDKAVLRRLRETLEQGEGFSGDAINYRQDGQEFHLEWQVAPLRKADGEITHFVAVQHDITDRKRFEAKLFQSQKLETVGKLAGGIAHEFNSILTAIIGQSELLLNDLPASSPLAGNVTEISKAAARAASLTRQLLAYGRKQILQPKALDLNAVLAGLEGSLHHLLGAGTQVRVIPDAGLHPVEADAGQIEQVIMNMTMNAGDAMPNGGILTLETANISLDAESVGRYPELKPGDYVMLAITDTGAGMNAEVKARAFEPFFTTKGIGLGTGLGLSTCDGIVKQSGGHISVYSEPALGTIFKIYLPQALRQTELPPPRRISTELPRGTETILLVEDDPALREMAATLLRRLGYTVLPAANGLDALNLRQERASGHIDLLFTDVIMPHMSGKDLADRVQALSPHTRILFTSAYTENAIVHQGAFIQGVSLLQKPFTPSALAHKIREVLEPQNALSPAGVA